jgi:hypothetical protein
LVVSEADGNVMGCHESRTDAVKQSAALYANESRVASMYAELDAQPDPEPVVQLEVEPVAAVSRVVKIEIPTDEALTASVMQQMERMSERQARTDQALVAALEAIGAKENIVNVHSAPITVNPTPVNVEAPNVTVEAPTVNVPPTTVNVAAPNVTVKAPDVVLPERQKTVTFERDPLTQQVTRAEVTEG